MELWIFSLDEERQIHRRKEGACAGAKHMSSNPGPTFRLFMLGKLFYLSEAKFPHQLNDETIRIPFTGLS